MPLLETELPLLFPRLPPLRWLTPGVALAQVDMGFKRFASECQRLKPVFLRHIAPAQREIALTGEADDLERLTEAALQLAPRLEKGRSFAVQARLVAEEERPYRTFTIHQTLAERVAQQNGLTLDVREPAQVISALIVHNTGWLGVSRVEQNRSAWAGGAQRFRQEEEQISRSEFKLLEALSVFRVRLPQQGWALDLGAAPGGWTRILRQRGLRVVALDPAELDARLQDDSGIQIVRRRIQDFRLGTQRFDLIVNDMRMDAQESADWMVRLAKGMKPGGRGMVTLKLPENEEPADTLRRIQEARSMLETAYQVLDIRQLYHNRSEVTALVACRLE